MSRDSSGNYTLPGATNPVVSGTNITILWGNGTANDIAQALTDSLDRNGQGGMLAPLRGVAGTAGAPAFSFTAESNSGWYRQGANSFRFSISASDVLAVTPTLFTSYKDMVINGCVVGQGAGADATNTAFGVSALGTVNTGINNTAFGWSNLTANTTGSNNTALGNGCLLDNLDGTSNIAIGSALEANTSGSDNVAIGWGSMIGVTTGSNNVAIGSDSGSDAVFTLSTQSNRIVMGNNLHTNAYVKVAWTVTSDERDKVLLGDVPLGLSFVMGLKPIKYQFKKSREDAAPVGPVRYGFSAQQVLDNEKIYGRPVIIDHENADKLQYTEANMVPVLVNAIQQLAKVVADLQMQLLTK